MVIVLADEAERMARASGRDGIERVRCACGSPAVPGVDHGPQRCQLAGVETVELPAGDLDDLDDLAGVDDGLVG